jgi:hypothetical protein
MSECTNPEIGDLLHGYELNTLSEKDADKFEIHLLQCEYCFKKFKKFQQKAGLLRTDKIIYEEIGKEMPKDEETVSVLSDLWKHLWPKGSFILKPAALYIIILLMITPAYHGTFMLMHQISHEVTQTLALLPQEYEVRDLRDANVIKKNLGGLITLTFHYPDALEGKHYRIVIEHQDGTAIYDNRGFNSFNVVNDGSLSFEASVFKPGKYILKVCDPEVDADTAVQEYRFSVADK